MKVLLDQTTKPKLIAFLETCDLDKEFVHQHIYYKEDFYMSSFDNLTCTWISKLFDKNTLDKNAQELQFSFYDPLSDDI